MYPARVAAEAMGLPSFQNLMADGLNKKVMGGYQSNFNNWREIAYVDYVNNFRNIDSIRITEFGDLTQLEEFEEYPFAAVHDTGQAYRAYKYGIRLGVSAELVTNDDTRTINRLPTKIGSAVGRTIAKFAYAFLIDNPNTYDGVALFHADHGNLITDVFGADGLKAAILAMMRQTGDPPKDEEGEDIGSGEPIDLTPAVLVVPPDLYFTAKEILNGTTLLELSAGVITAVKENVLASENIKLVKSQLLTDTTAWYLLADPNVAPVIEVDFVRGWGSGQGDQPRVLPKRPVYTGDPYDEVDALDYKVKIAYAGVSPDYRGGVKSTGAGS
jgi:phage major head subunit gpT-like protein